VPEKDRQSDAQAPLRPEHLWVLWGLAAVLVATVALRWGWREGWWSPRAKLVGSSTSQYRIDLNNADETELALLPGIGGVKAARIVAYRKERGAFRTLQDLLGVEGISESMLLRLEPYVTPGYETREGDESPSSVTSSSP